MAEAHETDAGREEPLTEELLKHLLASSSPEAYLSTEAIDDRSLADYLMDLLDQKGMTRADVVRASAINPTFVYQLFDGKRKAGRDTAIKLVLGMRCSLREAQRLLRHAGVSELWCKNRRDAIIIYCIEHGLDRAETDDELFRLGEKTLVSREG